MSGDVSVELLRESDTLGSRFGSVADSLFCIMTDIQLDSLQQSPDSSGAR